MCKTIQDTANCPTARGNLMIMIMQLRKIVAILILSSIVACNQVKHNHSRLSKGSVTTGSIISLLAVKNGDYRGRVYADSVGAIFNLLYMPISFSTSSNKPIDLLIAFKKNYKFPENNQEVFDILPLPTEWAVDGSEITGDMINELPNNRSYSSLQKTIAPEDSIFFAVALRYKRGKTGGLLPTELLIKKVKSDEPVCQPLKPFDNQAAEAEGLSLKISIGGKCFLMPGGTIKTINDT